MSEEVFYSQAVKDFHQARREALIQDIFARITGKSEQLELLSYEDVRKKLRLVEGSKQELKDIPLDAIVGSVGRYSDFTRNFLPLKDSDRSRWSWVMAKTSALEGLPPIDVYQIGETYFVIDGNHRVSVARQLEATHIQAYVTQVRSKLPLTPDVKPDDLIIKAEYIDFLEKTKIDQIRREADLSVTIPGQYPILEEHISVHRYFMGIEEKRQIPYSEAAAHWFDTVYTPVANLIRERGILHHFPERTETDLYLWITKYHAELQESLGWKISKELAADDLIETADLEISKSLSKVGSKILDIIIPDVLESGPPVGEWRREQLQFHSDDVIFSDILVAISPKDVGWLALEQAIVLAHREGNLSRIHGLHVVSEELSQDDDYLKSVQDAFSQRCKAAGLIGELAWERGNIARRICERARWVDIIVTTLLHPPEDKPLKRLSSGFRTMIRRCPRPILAVPGRVTKLGRALLAYDNRPKAKEALFMAAYFTSKWGIPLTVATVIQKGQPGEEYLADARNYLEKLSIQADYLLDECESISESILEIAEKNNNDLIILGGYEASPVYEIVVGSTVDQVLRDSQIPLMICR